MAKVAPREQMIGIETIGYDNNYSPCEYGTMNCNKYRINQDGNIMRVQPAGTTVINCTWFASGGAKCADTNGNRYDVTSAGIENGLRNISWR